jgi:hypothetical protein
MANQSDKEIPAPSCGTSLILKDHKEGKPVIQVAGKDPVTFLT